MADIQLRVIDTPVSTPETLSLEDKKDRSVKEYKASKIQLSDNIRQFDDRVKKVHTKNPFDHNTISIKEPDSVPSTPTAFQMISDPLYNTIGKFLGVDTLHEWNKDYDKVLEIVRWAKSKSGADGANELVQWLNGAANFVPSMGANSRKIDQLYLFSKIQEVK